MERFLYIKERGGSWHEEARNIRNGGIYLKGISRVRDDRWLCFHVVASICRSKPAKRKVVEHLASYFTSCSKWHRKPVVAVCAVWKSALIFELRFYVSQEANAKRFMISWRGRKIWIEGWITCLKARDKFKSFDIILDFGIEIIKNTLNLI